MVGLAARQRCAFGAVRVGLLGEWTGGIRIVVELFGFRIQSDSLQCCAIKFGITKEQGLR
jgi:hypothetical protein